MRIIKRILLFAIIITILIIGQRYLFSDLTVGKRYLMYSYYDGAIYKFQNALIKDPNNVEVHIYLGLAYGKKRDYDRALKEFQWVKDRGFEPKLKLPAHVYNDRGMIYYLLEMYEEAITDFKRAVRAKPNFVDAYFNMGTAFSALGQTQEAINAYRKALEINPHNAYTHWNLAINLEKIDDIEGAIEHWEKYIQFVLGVFRNPEAEKHLAELKARREKRRK